MATKKNCILRLLPASTAGRDFVREIRHILKVSDYYKLQLGAYVSTVELNPHVSNDFFFFILAFSMH
jgi:hypothetical protein